MLSRATKLQVASVFQEAPHIRDRVLFGEGYRMKGTEYSPCPKTAYKSNHSIALLEQSKF